MDVYVARQAIFNRRGAVFAYELLFRSNAESQDFGDADESAATNQVVANALLNFNTVHLLGGKKAFVNFNRPLLLDGLHALLPRETSVIEILETVDPDAGVVAACREIREQGYAIALDDFADGAGMNDLINLANFIKVDMRATPKNEQERIVQTYRRLGLAMVAEKVETHEEFRWASSIGFDYFQGYYFARPVTVVGHQVPASKIAALRLLRELQETDLEFHHIQEVVAADLGLSHKLMRYVNSAAFARRRELTSIQSALAVLGEQYMRRWIVLAALPALATDKPGELITQSILRARFWELLATAAGVPNHERLFLMGMFSLLDALIDQPLSVALQEVGVAAPIAAALLGEARPNDPLALIRELALEYERGEWDSVALVGARLGISGADVVFAYTEALKWTEEMLPGTK